MHPAGHLVRAGVARADRLRRSRETAGRVWRAAPIAAAICVAAAAGSRWAGWPTFIPLGALGLAAAVLAAYVYFTRRDRTISDATAAAIDAQAGLNGELRSATWFASRESQDPWIAFHLGSAADRVQAIDWAALYPAVRARRAKAASALLVIGALALALTFPGRIGMHASASGNGADPSPGLKPARAGSLPAELQKRLENLLSMAESGVATSDGRTLTAAEVRDVLAQLARLQDPHASKDGKPGAAGASPAASPADLKAFAQRAKRASEMTALAPEVRDALSDLADKLRGATDPAQTTSKDPQDAMASPQPQTGDAAPSTKPGSSGEMSMQSVKDPNAGGNIGVIMMSSRDASASQDPGMGLGGSAGRHNNRGRMEDIGAALRRETIEANADSPGENVVTGIRRKTERGDATVAYTHLAPRGFERGRSTAPPAVPEGRRAAVQTYFTRRQ